MTFFLEAQEIWLVRTKLAYAKNGLRDCKQLRARENLNSPIFRSLCVDFCCEHSTDNMTIVGCLEFGAVFYTLKYLILRWMYSTLEITEPQLLQ